MCNVQCYDALIDFIVHYLKRDRPKYKEWGWKKEGHEHLDILSFIADIRPDFEFALWWTKETF